MSKLLTWLQRDEQEETPEGASRAQVIIMFALFAAAMFGILGLAIDGGYAFAQRRSVQSAADLAAVAGARAVVRYTAATPTSANADATAMLTGNEMGGVTFELTKCRYVTFEGDIWEDSDDIVFQELGLCTSNVPIEATGVTVEVEEQHETFFIRIFPWAPSHLTVSASSTAYAERTKNAGVDSRFIVCGVNTKTVTSLSDTAAPSGTTSILQSDGSGITINPDAIGKTFRIVDNTIANLARCNAPTTLLSGWNSWKGMALPDQFGNVDTGKEIGGDWYIKTGTTLSWQNILNNIPGFKGCLAETAAPYNCVAIIPIACDSTLGCPNPTGNGQGSTVTSPTTPRIMRVAASAAFLIQRCGTTTCLNGTLIDDYLLADMTYPGNSGPIPWTRDSGGVIGIKLKRLSD
jgi:hypothetical protein